MIDRRVRVAGQQQLDDNDRLVGILVANVELVPELQALAQGAFFERHELVFHPASTDDAMNGVVDDLSDDEAANFLATLARND